jgi:rod shape-determining protein MreD
MQNVQPQAILLPVRTGFIVLTLAVAGLLNLLQWGGVWRWLRPDFVALVLLYWSVHQPRRLGFGVAWMLGLAMDIADASLFGQHALAYTVLIYAGIVLARRVLSFGVVNQILTIAPMLFVNDLIVLIVRVMTGADFPGPGYFAGSFLGALLWAPVSILFRLPQIPKSDPHTGVHVP